MIANCRVVVAAVLLAVTALAADPRAIPKDTLPAKLPVDAVPLGLGFLPAGGADVAVIESRAQLGRKLFFDPILSADRTIACASCHHPEHGFASSEGIPMGIRGQRLNRRAPSLMNRALGKSFFWDGRAATLEEQALMPIEDPREMGSSVDEAVNRLKADASYRGVFAKAFADGVTARNLGAAIASFERTLLRGDSRIDKFRQNGDVAAISPDERHGLWLYESKARCWRCHSGTNFTDEAFHNTGVAWGREPLDFGRFGVTKNESDRGKFKTPTLRGVALTAPYMHDGSMKTLEEVIEFYSRGGNDNPHRDALLVPLELSKEEVAALVAFLKAL